MVRIRYKPVNDLLLTKQQYILPTGQVVEGLIDTEIEFKASVLEIDRQVNHWNGGPYKALKDAKKALKAALLSLGVEFGTELRAKKIHEPADYQTAVKQEE